MKRNIGMIRINKDFMARGCTLIYHDLPGHGSPLIHSNSRLRVFPYLRHKKWSNLSAFIKTFANMKILDIIQKEFDQEVALTRKMLDRVPDDKWDWKPHEKSMDMKALTVHLAEIPGWVAFGFSSDELDFAKTPYKPTPVNSKKELLELLEKNAQSGREALQKATEEQLEPSWTMKYGDKILMQLTKYELIRHSLNQLAHHRAQLGVYLRLLNIPIPGTYGPSADDGMGF
jgi:uncharacterized damage-inducible protein DinB